MATDYSDIWFGTVDLPLARAIAWAIRGYGHVALISKLRPGMWLDARGGGIAYRKPEVGLHNHEIVRLPFDIEEAAVKHIGEPYNYRGIVAFAFHFYWHGKGGFCSQAFLQWCRESNHPLVDEVHEDEVNPGVACWLAKCYVRGLQGGVHGN